MSLFLSDYRSPISIRKKIIKVIVALIFFSLAESLVLPNFRKQIAHFSQDLVFTYKVGEVVTLIHASCFRHENFGTEKSGKKCKITVEIPNTKFQKKVCDVSLLPRNRLGSVGRKYQLVQFGTDKVIFVWKEEYEKQERQRNSEESLKEGYVKEHLRVRVIDMRNCDFVEINVVLDEKKVIAEDYKSTDNLNIVTYENGTMHLFFRNEHYCGKEYRCKQTYDPSTGKFIFPIVRSLPVDYDSSASIYPMQSYDYSNTLAYIVQTLDDEEGSVRIISPDGQTIYLNHLFSWSFFNLPRRISKLAFSTGMEALGFCQQPMFEPTLKCSVFKSHGSAHLGIEIALKSPDIAILKIRNEFGGGFLLLLAYVLDYKTNTFESIDVVRIGGNGQTLNSETVQNFECPTTDSYVDVDFFSMPGYKYCIFMVCTRPEVDSLWTDIDYHFKIYTACYEPLEIGFKDGV